MNNAIYGPTVDFYHPSSSNVLMQWVEELRKCYGKRVTKRIFKRETKLRKWHSRIDDLDKVANRYLDAGNIAKYFKYASKRDKLIEKYNRLVGKNQNLFGQNNNQIRTNPQAPVKQPATQQANANPQAPAAQQTNANSQTVGNTTNANKNYEKEIQSFEKAIDGGVRGLVSDAKGFSANVRSALLHHNVTFKKEYKDVTYNLNGEIVNTGEKAPINSTGQFDFRCFDKELLKKKELIKVCLMTDPLSIMTLPCETYISHKQEFVDAFKVGMEDQIKQGKTNFVDPSSGLQVKEINEVVALFHNYDERKQEQYEELKKLEKKEAKKKAKEDAEAKKNAEKAEKDKATADQKVKSEAGKKNVSAGGKTEEKEQLEKLKGKLSGENGKSNETSDARQKPIGEVKQPTAHQPAAQQANAKPQATAKDQTSNNNQQNTSVKPKTEKEELRKGLAEMAAARQAYLNRSHKGATANQQPAAQQTNAIKNGELTEKTNETPKYVMDVVEKIKQNPLYVKELTPGAFAKHADVVLPAMCDGLRKIEQENNNWLKDPKSNKRIDHKHILIECEKAYDRAAEAERRMGLVKDGKRVEIGNKMGVEK